MPEPRAATTTPGGGHRVHFTTLDGLRGLVALVVLVWHIIGPLHLQSLMRRGYLGVDFFFLLSGVVIAVAYEERLRDGMPLLRFARIRLVRLYPLFALGTLLGAAVSVVKLTLTDHFEPLAFASALAEGLLFVPLGRIGATVTLFPFDLPAWSLFYEVVVNAAFALLVGWLAPHRLRWLVAGTAILFFVGAVQTGTLDFGGDRDAWPSAIGRVAFSFFLGVMIGRLARQGRLRITTTRSFAWTCVLLLLVFACPQPLPEWLFQCACVAIVFPLVLVIGISRQPRGRWCSVSDWAGRLSYPLYILHYPVLRVFLYFIEKYRINGSALLLVTIVEAATAIGVAYLALVWFDEPLREWLLRRRADRRIAVA